MSNERIDIKDSDLKAKLKKISKEVFGKENITNTLRYLVSKYELHK